MGTRKSQMVMHKQFQQLAKSTKQQNLQTRTRKIGLLMIRTLKMKSRLKMEVLDFMIATRPRSGFFFFNIGLQIIKVD